MRGNRRQMRIEDETERYIMNKLDISEEEFRSIFNLAESINRLRDGIVAIDTLIKANRIMSKMYAKVKGELAELATTKDDEIRKIYDNIITYITQVNQEKRIPIHLKDTSEDPNAKEERKVQYTTVNIRDYTEGEVPNLTQPQARKYAESIAKGRLRSRIDELSVKHDVITKLIDGLGREISCMSSLARLLESEHRGLNLRDRSHNYYRLQGPDTES